VEDVCKEGDKLTVKVLSIDPEGKVRLSHRETIPPPEGYVPPAGNGERRAGGDGDRRGPPRGRRPGGDRDRPRRRR
jgi:hypothetical protein